MSRENSTCRRAWPEANQIRSMAKIEFVEREFDLNLKLALNTDGY